MEVQVDNKSKKVRSLTILSLLLALALLALAVFSYKLYDDKKATQSDLSSAETENSSLASKVNSLEQMSTAKISDDDTETQTNPKDESTSIIESVKVYSAAKGTTDAEFKVEKREGEFARVAVTDKASGTGFSCIVKNVSEKWVTIYCGQGETAATEELDQEFKVPASIKQ
jgi:hypothetical protein